MALPIIGSPEDLEKMQKVFELIGKFAPFINALLEDMPPLEVKELLIPDAKGEKKEYIGLLLPKKTPIEVKK